MRDKAYGAIRLRRMRARGDGAALRLLGFAGAQPNLPRYQHLRPANHNRLQRGQSWLRRILRRAGGVLYPGAVRSGG